MIAGGKIKSISMYADVSDDPAYQLGMLPKRSLLKDSC
ncbi:MAG: hypothetical protein QOG51_948 [Verrucomicrobiota bacterium]